MRRLAISVGTGRVCAVFLDGERLIGWRRSASAFSDTAAARCLVQKWIKGFQPDQLLLEDFDSRARKGPQSQEITETIAQVFADADGLDVRVRREQRHDNKYEEAAWLAELYPPAKAILPKRPAIWVSTPRNMGFFEALSLVEQLRQAPPTN